MLCQKFFKKDKPLSFIASLDANSLYSSTLDMAHIIGGFSLLNEAEINDFFIFLQNREYVDSWNDDRAIEETDPVSGEMHWYGFTVVCDVQIDPSQAQKFRYCL